MGNSQIKTLNDVKNFDDLSKNLVMQYLGATDELIHREKMKYVFLEFRKIGWLHFETGYFSKWILIESADIKDGSIYPLTDLCKEKVRAKLKNNPWISYEIKSYQPLDWSFGRSWKG